MLHDNKVVYVGKATVLRQRWDSHHRIKEFKNLPGEVRIAWLICDNPELIDELEKSMITRDGTFDEWFQSRICNPTEDNLS